MYAAVHLRLQGATVVGRRSAHHRTGITVLCFKKPGLFSEQYGPAVRQSASQVHALAGKTAVRIPLCIDRFITGKHSTSLSVSLCLCLPACRAVCPPVSLLYKVLFCAWQLLFFLNKMDPIHSRAKVFVLPLSCMYKTRCLQHDCLYSITY